MTCLADRQSFGKLLIIKEECNYIFIQNVLKLLNTARSVKSIAVLWQFFWCYMNHNSSKVETNT